MFNGGAKKDTTSGGGAESDSDPFSDDDFAKLKNPAKKEKSITQDSDVEIQEIQPAPRTKRTAASKAKRFIVDDDDESESDDDKMLGDVSDLVKGITKGNTSASENKTGRLSLFSMSRPDSSSGNSTGLKVKSKPSKVLDLDDHDDTNYEMLAKPSPHKNNRGNELDSFLSDDDLPPVSKALSKAKPSKEEPKLKPRSKPATAAASTSEPAVKARGRPAATKTKSKEDAPVKKAPASKAAHLSPAAKAYAAKKEKAKPKKEFSTWTMMKTTISKWLILIPPRRNPRLVVDLVELQQPSQSQSISSTMTMMKTKTAYRWLMTTMTTTMNRVMNSPWTTASDSRNN